MCGILAAFNTKIKNKVTPDVNDFIVNQYEDQCNRGQKGFGIIRIDEKRNIEMDRSTEPVKFLLDLYLKKSKMIIAHHRTPTSTANTLQQTHPMSISDAQLEFDYEIIHNGIIINTEDLYKKHKELGFVYNTEVQEYGYGDSIRTKWNDSESIAIELAMFIEKKITAIGTDNNAAFIALQIDKRTRKALKVFFGKNGISADLTMYKTKGALRISSEGAGDEIEVNELYSFKLNDKKMTLSKRKMEFKKHEIPVIIEKKEGEPFPSTITRDVITTNTQTMNKVDLETTVRGKREWITEDDIRKTSTLFATEIEKGYVELASAAIKERTKDEESSAIPKIVEDSLEDEIDKITEILGEYKEALLCEKFEDRDIFYYSSQIFRITKAMKVITELAEQDCRNKLDMEEELEAYNKSGYLSEGWDGRTYEERTAKGNMGFHNG